MLSVPTPLYALFSTVPPTTQISTLSLHDALRSPLLDHPQQLGLRGRRQLADLVQEQRPARGGLEGSLAERVRARKGAALVTEQLVFDEVLGERGAVEGDERAFRIRAEAVQLAGDELLSRSALSHDEHGARNLGHARDRVLEPLHGRACAHERRLAVEALAHGGDLAREPLSLQRLHELMHHTLHGLGLVDVASHDNTAGISAEVVLPRPGDAELGLTV